MAAKNIKAVIWKWKFARRLQDIGNADWLMAWECATEALAGFDGDLSECPIDAADTEMSYWDDQ